MSTLQIPALYSPFPSTLHPCGPQVQQESVSRWSQRMGFQAADPEYQALQAGQLALRMGRCHPLATRETLALLTDFTTWRLLWDDQAAQVDEHGLAWWPERLQVMNERAQRLLLGHAPEEEDGPLVWGLWHLLEGLKARMSGRWLHRFTYHLQEYLEATVWQATRPHGGHVPDVETCVRMRRLTRGVFLEVDLIEVAQGREVPLQARLHPLVAGMVRCAVSAATWAQDIFSLGEQPRHGGRHNLVRVLHERGRTVEQALREAAALHNAEVRHFIDCGNALPSFGAGEDEAVAGYVNGLRCWMRAHLDGSSLDGRDRPGLELPAEAA